MSKNMKIKAIVAVLFALCCCAFLFAACSFIQDDENGPETSIEKTESYKAYLFTYDEYLGYRRAENKEEYLSQIESNSEISAGVSSPNTLYGNCVFMIEYERSGDWGESISNYFSFTLKSAGAFSPAKINSVTIEEDHNGQALSEYAYTDEIDVVMDLPEEYQDSGMYNKDCVPYFDKYNSLPLKVPEGKETASTYIAFYFTPERAGTLYIEYKLWSEESQEYEWSEENIFITTVREEGKAVVPASVSGLSFGSVSEEEYYSGDIAENLNNAVSMEIGLVGKSYFVVDFDILAQADSSGMSSVGLGVYFSDTSWCDIIVEEAPSSNVSVLPSGKGTAVDIAFRIPDRAGAAQSRRSVISILPSGNGYCSVDIFLYSGMSEEYSEYTSLNGAQWLKADIQTTEYVADFRYEPTGDGYTIYGEAQALENRDTLVIPDFYRGLPVKAIGEGAFAGLAVRTVTLGNNIESIGKNAFADCTALEEVSVNSDTNNFISVGISAFENCTALSEVSFLMRGVGSSAFANCTSLERAKLRGDDGNYSIGAFAFSNCTALWDIDIGTGLTSVGGSAFSNCTRVTTIHLPISLRSIGMNAFEGCSNLHDLYLESSSLNETDWYLYADPQTGPREEADLVLDGAELDDSAQAALWLTTLYAEYSWVGWDRYN